MRFRCIIPDIEINKDFLDLTGSYRIFKINCKFGRWKEMSGSGVHNSHGLLSMYRKKWQG